MNSLPFRSGLVTPAIEVVLMRLYPNKLIVRDWYKMTDQGVPTFGTLESLAQAVLYYAS